MLFCHWSSEATVPFKCPALETKDKPQISYSEIRGYSKVYLWVKFRRFSNAFYSWDNSTVFVNKHLIGQQGHVTWHRLFMVWHNFLTLHHVTSDLSTDMNNHVYGA